MSKKGQSLRIVLILLILITLLTGECLALNPAKNFRDGLYGFFRTAKRVAGDLAAGLCYLEGAISITISDVIGIVDNHFPGKYVFDGFISEFFAEIACQGDLGGTSILETWSRHKYADVPIEQPVHMEEGVVFHKKSYNLYFYGLGGVFVGLSDFWLGMPSDLFQTFSLVRPAKIMDDLADKAAEWVFGSILEDYSKGKPTD